ncbi:unnamed protein product [Gordionus sp. m RMFG-2023]
MNVSIPTSVVNIYALTQRGHINVNATMGSNSIPIKRHAVELDQKRFNISNIIDDVRTALIKPSKDLDSKMKNMFITDNQDYSDYYDINFLENTPKYNSKNINATIFPKRRHDMTSDRMLIMVDYDKLAYAMDRLEFLSKQLANVEEQLGMCKCIN